MLDTTPASWEASLLRRLQREPRDAEAIIELYDRVGVEIWAYARSRVRSRRKARRAVIAAFVKAAAAPEVFAELRVSMQIRMLLIVHLETARTGRRLHGSRQPLS